MQTVTLDQILQDNAQKNVKARSLAGQLLGDVSAAELTACLPAAEKRDEGRVYVSTAAGEVASTGIRELSVTDEEE